MKRILLFACSLSLCLSVDTIQAQVNNPSQVAKDAATNHANSDMDNAADQGLDKAEQGIGNLFKKKKKKNSGNAPAAAPANNSTSSSGNGNDASSSTSPAPAIKSYQNYDFVAGDKIVFTDDFTGDQDGEFPAHWGLNKGQAVVNRQQGFPAFTLTDGNYVEVYPKMTEKSYLGSEFTLEYDVYFESGGYGVSLLLHLPDGQDNEDASLSVTNDEASYYSDQANVSLRASFPEAIAGSNYENKWHHVAIGYKNKQVKVYVDQYRVLVVPDCKMEFGSVTFAGLATQEAPIIFKNVKIAQGGSQNMIGNILTNGKFVTHGITFDVDKSVIKPESMGVLNQVAKFLKENSSVRMEIDGHTDNSGAAAHNLTLSQQRADAVKAQLVSMGVDASRLSTKGFGDTKPIADNGTPEGKADNRRVEFVKK
jgi:outer membrane protein OmpA-like peptidoglycan-associated protein